MGDETKVDDVKVDDVKVDDKEPMIPESRLRGLAKQNAELSQKLRALEEVANAKKIEGLSETERLKVEKEAATNKAAELATKHAALETKLKRAAILNHWKDAATPRVADLIDLDKVALDDNGEIDETSKILLKDWRSKDENKPLFNSQRRGGTTPAPSDGAGAMTKEAYARILSDPKATPAEKQKAHEQFMATFLQRQ